MQFGRVAEDRFSLDFMFPLTCTQAFGIALTAFHGRISLD